MFLSVYSSDGYVVFLVFLWIKKGYFSVAHESHAPGKIPFAMNSLQIRQVSCTISEEESLRIRSADKVICASSSVSSILVFPRL